MMRRGVGGWRMAVVWMAAGCTTPTAKGEREPELLVRAEEEFLRENYDAAVFRYEHYLTLNPETPKRARICFHLGLCWNGRGEYERAIRSFGDALRAGPDGALRVAILYRRAIAHNFCDQPDLALTDLEAVGASSVEVRERAVKTAEYQRIWGVTEIRAGQWERGRRILRELLVKDKDNPEAVMAARLLKYEKFCVQVAVCPDEKTAQKKIESLKKIGVEGRAVALSDHPGIPILVGSFSRYADVVAEREALSQKGISGFILP